MSHDQSTPNLLIRGARRAADLTERRADLASVAPIDLRIAGGRIVEQGAALEPQDGERVIEADGLVALTGGAGAAVWEVTSSNSGATSAITLDAFVTFAAAPAAATMAPPIAGTWLVKIPPIICAMSESLRLIEKHLFESVNAHAGLLRPDILHVQAKNTGKLCEVINIPALCDHGEDIAVLHGLALRRRQVELGVIGIFIGKECLAICLVVEGKAHGIERISLLRGIAIEHRSSGNHPFCCCRHTAAPLHMTD